MNSGSEERDRMAELWDEFERTNEDGPDGTEVLLLRTFTETTYPTTASAVYACHPVGIDVDETEGATPSLSADTSQTAYALNVGTQIPASGTDVLAYAVGGRYVFRWDTAP